MPTMSRPAVPHAGDIVIYQRDGSGEAYLLSAFQHASQLTTHTYDDAIRGAMRYAARNRVDVWYTADGASYRRITTR